METGAMVVLRYLLGKAETMVLIFPKNGGALFSLFFMAAVALGGCKVVGATCLLGAGCWQGRAVLLGSFTVDPSGMLWRVFEPHFSLL